MRKTLFALLFLLFLLIIACVYQKTYTLYAIQTTKEQAPVVIIHEEIIKTIKNEEIATVVRKTPQKKTVVHKNYEEKVQTTQKSTEKQHIVISHTPEISKKEIQNVENDAVDYLLTVLKEHKDVLSERDKAESRLHALIEKVLEDRKKAILSMEEIATSSATTQARRIEKRDQTSQIIIQNHTKGK